MRAGVVTVAAQYSRSPTRNAAQALIKDQLEVAANTDPSLEHRQNTTS